MHVTTLGTPHRDASGRIDNAVMVLHGTGGTGKQFFRPQFADELLRARRAARHRALLRRSCPTTSATAARRSRATACAMTFPHYDYADMVAAAARLLEEGLGVTRCG